MDAQNKYEDMKKAEKQWDEHAKKADDNAEKELDDAKFKAFMHSVYKDNFFN